MAGNVQFDPFETGKWKGKKYVGLLLGLLVWRGEGRDGKRFVPCVPDLYFESQVKWCVKFVGVCSAY